MREVASKQAVLSLPTAHIYGLLFQLTAKPKDPALLGYMLRYWTRELLAEGYRNTCTHQGANTYKVYTPKKQANLPRLFEVERKARITSCVYPQAVPISSVTHVAQLPQHG